MRNQGSLCRVSHTGGSQGLGTAGSMEGERLRAPQALWLSKASLLGELELRKFFCLWVRPLSTVPGPGSTRLILLPVVMRLASCVTIK